MAKRNADRSRSAAGPSQRQLRVGTEIRHALSSTLQRGEVRDPDLEGVSITVTEVRLSPDLRNATAFVMPLGGGNLEKILPALRRVAPFLRRQIASSVSLKYNPQLSFQADQSFEEASKIGRVLNSPAVQRDLQKSETETLSDDETVSEDETTPEEGPEDHDSSLTHAHPHSGQ